MKQVDFLFPWVNPRDTVWQEAYKKFTGKPLDPNSPRFRDWGLLRYLFRAIATNLPFIRNCCIIVSNKTQIPKWVNRNTVRIITHDEFIPKVFLPMFNSCGIECFLSNIPKLSEYIIYGNDDVYPINPCVDGDFFSDSGFIKIAFRHKSTTKSSFLVSVKNTSDMIRAHFSKNNLPNEIFLKPFHTLIPMRKSTIDLVYKTFNKKILDSVTQIRDNYVNYNQYMYTDYEIFNGTYVKLNIQKVGKYTSLGENSARVICEFINKPVKTWRSLCINDIEVFNASDITQIELALLNKFPNKCKYEV